MCTCKGNFYDMWLYLIVMQLQLLQFMLKLFSVSSSGVFKTKFFNLKYILFFLKIKKDLLLKFVVFI